jgi:hypothetical protein
VAWGIGRSRLSVYCVSHGSLLWFIGLHHRDLMAQVKKSRTPGRSEPRKAENGWVPLRGDDFPIARTGGDFNVPISKVRVLRPANSGDSPE